jgi:hypothetical protein
MAQVVEHLPSKFEALSSNSGTAPQPPTKKNFFVKIGYSTTKPTDKWSRGCSYHTEKSEPRKCPMCSEPC